jgi:hypothetical protein
MRTAGLTTMAYYYFDSRDIKSSPSYFRTMLVERESRLLARLQNA